MKTLKKKRINVLDGLTSAFTKGSEVLIACSKDDITNIFSKLKPKKGENYGVFKNSYNLNCKSVMKNGVTLHFINEDHMVDLAKKILKI